MANLSDQKSLTASSGGLAAAGPSPSVGAAAPGGGGGGGAPAAALLSPLKALLESATLQQEVMREMVSGELGAVPNL